MKITPLEIRQHEFEKTFRGYNIEEVDNFLANLSQEWERILNESKMLRMQLEMAEKEASKLREIEMTLFKTLKTAEDTSTMITEQANQQADKHIQESKLKSDEILQEARAKAEEILRDAHTKAKYIKDEVLGEVKALERDFKAMDHYKTNLLVQMRSLSNATLEHVQRFEDKFDKEGINKKILEASNILSGGIEIPDLREDEPEVPETEAIVEELIESEEMSVEELPETISEDGMEESSEEITGDETEERVEETLPEIEQEDQKKEDVAFQSSANDIIEDGPTEEFAETEEPNHNLIQDIQTPIVQKTSATESSKVDELDLIEGIGPKIAMLLYDAGIFTFKDLATTPVFKIREILENAGPHYAMHDPSTWVEQALLAAEGRFEELEEMKGRLVGGRIVEDVEEKGIDSNVAFFDTIGATKEEESDVKTEEHEIPVSKAEDLKEEPKPIVDNNIESITEEMLEKVNKVKAAIRKAMVEKSDSQAKDSTPLPTVNDVIGKSNDNGSGGSFFDNI
ncbi:DivIVA domain-containing protein [Emticicia sp. BO119]|uniref:DivIVA domain-containing protein n=1 Tax=Emticicia sp. BO119 TaxID=2757768 RepID=UPI0015EFF599|nr:DivIVA domain-containing protein [Emticicia sp. BO119]MBA4852434.1 DivIVA domain-containing protein [Emticicia sp. BO119]